MDVLIYVNYQGKEYCWDEFTEKLNKQTANQLGYVKSN